MSLPYPGKYESFASWDYRCKEWELNRRRSQSRGLSGRPNKRYIEGGKDGTREEYVKIAGKYQKVKLPMIGTHNGLKIRIYKIGYGYQNAMRVQTFAQKNGFSFYKKNGNGYSGMCERIDGVAFKYIQ